MRLAVGLPLTWVSRQREDFKVYLTRNREPSFIFREKPTGWNRRGGCVSPGLRQVAGQIRDFQGMNMLCDIGNGTMNIMFINDRKPILDRMFTENYGTHQCICWPSGRNVMRTHHATVDDAIINRVLRFGTADIREDYLTTIRETAAEYGRIRILREHEYDPAPHAAPHVLGDGGCLVRNFGAYDAGRVTI